MTVEKDESKTRLTPAEWAEAEAKWTSGEYTLSKLEEEYGIRRETLSRHFKKWIRERRRFCWKDGTRVSQVRCRTAR